MVTRRRKVKTSNSTGGQKDVWRDNPDVIRRFLEQRPDYEQLCTEIAYILNKRLNAQGIEFSGVTWRAKTLKSFLEKIERKKYEDPFKSITDFAGVRVVCLYLNDIPAIEQTIRDEFEVMEKVDKLHDKGADRFGYGALHFTVKIGKNSSGARYDDLKDLLCEVQVRTVLQDAWAIIDHHLVYKNESDVPTPLQRKLNSLAGLFETADDQFDRIRSERVVYLENVRSSQSSPHQFLNNEVNRDSFIEYLKWRFPEFRLEYYDGQADFALNKLDRSKYQRLSDLDAAYQKAKNALEKVNLALGEKPPEWVNSAAFQIIVSLLLIDKDLRGRVPVHDETLEGAIQKYLVQ